MSSSCCSHEQYLIEAEAKIRELEEENKGLEEQAKNEAGNRKLLGNALASAHESLAAAEGARAELTKELAQKEKERKEAVGVQVLEADQYNRQIEHLQDTLDGLQAEHKEQLTRMEKRYSKHLSSLIKTCETLDKKTEEVKELRARLDQLGQPQEPAEEEERKQSWSTDFGGAVSFGSSEKPSLADELAASMDESSSSPSRPHSPAHSPTNVSPAPSLPDDSDDGSSATGVTNASPAHSPAPSLPNDSPIPSLPNDSPVPSIPFDSPIPSLPNDSDDGSNATGVTHDDGTTDLEQDEPAAPAKSPYGSLKALLQQDRPLAFDDHNPYEEAFRLASPVFGQPDELPDVGGPFDALQAVEMFPQERRERNSLARKLQEQSEKVDAIVAKFQKQGLENVRAAQQDLDDYAADLDAKRLEELREAESKTVNVWNFFTERVQVMMQHQAALEEIIRLQGIEVSYLEARPDAQKTEDELNELATRKNLVVNPVRIAGIPDSERSPTVRSISSPTTIAAPPNSPTSPTTTIASSAAATTTTPSPSSCPRLHVWIWPFFVFLFALLTLFWFAGQSESERQLWLDANEGARLSTVGHLGYGGRLSYRLFTPVPRSLYTNSSGYFPEELQQQQVWLHPVVRISAALVEPVFASVQVVVARFAVVLGCLVGLR